MASVVRAPHYQVPMKFTAAGVPVLEQDTEEEIYQTASTVLYYQKGQRTALQDYGVPDLAMQMGGVDTPTLKNAVISWDDRASAIATHKLSGMVDEAQVVIGEQING